MNVSINISARDLLDVELPERFGALLKKHHCAPSWITLELTESAILDDPDNGLENLRRLHALGCRLAIDDYGTGYSSLAYLRRLPVHELKIDKTFIVGMAHNSGDAVIVRSTIDLAHNLGLTVVAEGVEDEADARALARARLRPRAGLPAGASARRRRRRAMDAHVAVGTRRPRGRGAAARGVGKRDVILAKAPASPLPSSPRKRRHRHCRHPRESAGIATAVIPIYA